MPSPSTVRAVDQIVETVLRLLERSNLLSRAVPVTVRFTSPAVPTVDGAPGLTVSWRGGDVPASYLAGLTLTPGAQYVAIKTGMQLLVIGRAAGVPVDGGEIP